MHLMRILLIGNLILLPHVSWSLCVSVGQANLRDKPSASGKLLWTVGRYMPLLEVKSQGEWYQVQDLERKKMWIHYSLVSEDIDCAVIKIRQTNLRKGPGTEFGRTPLAVAFKYMPFKKLQREEAWLYLEDPYGGKHWVNEKNLWEPLAYTSLTY